MNTTLPEPKRFPAITPGGRVAWADRALIANWSRFLFVHFSVAPEVLAPHVPFELETWNGRAFVSLVLFRLERMRMPVLGGLGELLLRPVSDHPFLNVRTYVTEAGRGGICFLAEWIDNPVSLWLGPATYGLPYRAGRFAREVHDGEGVIRAHVHDPKVGAALHLTFPAEVEPWRACDPGTNESFLLERYEAYTFRGPVRRRFAVAHAPWRIGTADWIRFDPGLLERVFPWFAAAEYHSAHLSPGVVDVEMGRPHRL